MSLNPIDRAVFEIKFAIPREILTEVFKPLTFTWSPASISIDEQIINKIIRPKVFIDANIVGGTEVVIPTQGLPRQQSDEYTTVFHVPKNVTQGRSILAPLSISYMDSATLSAYNQTSIYDPCSITAVGQYAEALFNSANTVVMPSTARVELVAENTIMVRDTLRVQAVGFLRCILAYDQNMSQIKVGSILDFTELAVLGAKAYIYNEYRVRLDEGRVKGGFELGVFREIVEGYSDAREQYNEYLREIWRRVAHMNDRESYERLIRMQIGGMR
jgi:hypothetical protein